MPPRVVAFDVNETLLDMSGLDPHFETAFGSSAVRAQWFSQMLQLAFVGAITDRYVDFSSAQEAALAMLAERQGVELTAGDAQRILRGVRELEPHADAADALDRLRAGGFTLAALTNSPLDAAHAWDVAGALAAGCSAAFVARPGMVASPLGEQPDIKGADLGEVADGM